MEILTTYRAKGKTIGLEFLFKYDLNGSLKVFEIVDGELNGEQMQWLFSSNFPATEEIIKTNWIKLEKYEKVFEITTSPAVITFEALWNLYDYKVKRFDAEKSFSKLKEHEVIKCFTSIPGYNKYLQRKQIAKAHLSTFINRRYFEDDFNKVQ